MRYVVYGAGAVGGVIGARLELAGLDTTVVARGDHLSRIRADGLVLDSADGRRTARPAAAGTAAEVAWSHDSVVLLCVKSHQTLAALADLAAHAPPGTAVVAAQNGVANEAAVLRRFEHTYGLCVMLPSWHLEPGVVVAKCHPVPGILDLGRYPSGVDATATSVAADLTTAGFVSEPRDDIMAWKHRKLVVNAVGDARTLLGDDAAEAVRAEGETVLAAADIPVVTAAQDAARRGDLLQERPDSDAFPGNSLRQSLTRSLPTEIDYRAGEVVLLGRLHGVPTPVSERVVSEVQAQSART